MVDFVVDKGILKLRSQIDAAAPGRSKASDGTVGDLDHQSRDSEHNPEDTADSSDGNDPDNQVDAGDFTHDPAHGADMHVISEAIRLSKDRRVLYVIFNGRIFSRYAVNGVPAWTWRPYTGSNKHTEHMHVSVVDSPNDYTADWSIGVDDMDMHELVTSAVFPLNAPKMSLGSTWLSTFNDVRTILANQAADKARDEALLALVQSLVKVVNEGGGDVDTAAMIAKLEDVRASVLAKVEDEVNELKATNLELQIRLAAALQGPPQ